jgi:hypothetical protein
MSTISLNYLLKDFKKLDKDELFEKFKELYYDNEKLTNRIFELEVDLKKEKEKNAKEKAKKSTQLDYKGYNKDWVMAEKIVFILKMNKKAMSGREISNELLKLEPNFNLIYDDKVKSISSFIYNTVRLGYVVRVDKKIGGGYKYGLKKD